MTSPITLVLDESCARLQDAVGELAPVEVFRRVAGFRCESRVAAAELQQWLTERELVGRAVYVAPSFAGFTGLLHADKHPGSLVGLLLLDPSHPRQGPAARQILADLPTTAALERVRSLLLGFGPAWEQSCRDVARVQNLGNLTLRILAGAKFDLLPELPEGIKTRLIQSRHSMLLEYCTLSRDATFEVAAKAGHDVVQQAPEDVLAAIRRILSATETCRSR